MKNMKKSLFFIIAFVIIFAIFYVFSFQSTVSNESIVAKIYNYNAEKPILQAHDKGDVNDDGKIDDEDEKLIQEYINNKTSFTEEQKERADLDQDGEISKNDAMQLHMFISENGRQEGNGRPEENERPSNMENQMQPQNPQNQNPQREVKPEDATMKNMVIIIAVVVIIIIIAIFLYFKLRKKS